MRLRCMSYIHKDQQVFVNLHGVCRQATARPPPPPVAKSCNADGHMLPHATRGTFAGGAAQGSLLPVGLGGHPSSQLPGSAARGGRWPCRHDQTAPPGRSLQWRPGQNHATGRRMPPSIEHVGNIDTNMHQDIPTNADDSKFSSKPSNIDSSKPLRLRKGSFASAFFFC